jgi:hypothetical protein
MKANNNSWYTTQHNISADKYKFSTTNTKGKKQYNSPCDTTYFFGITTYDTTYFFGITTYLQMIRIQILAR